MSTVVSILFQRLGCCPKLEILTIKGNASFAGIADRASRSLHACAQLAPEVALERPDAAQVAAIAADEPAILLVAGAGTGKTRVLAARLAHVLRRAALDSSAATAGAAPRVALVLSFTSTAAQEICRRAAALPGGAEALDPRVVWHGTFHSFAVRLLAQYPYLGTGLSRFTVADTQDQQAAMQLALRDAAREGGGGGAGALAAGAAAARWAGALGGGDAAAGHPRAAHAALRKVAAREEQSNADPMHQRRFFFFITYPRSKL